MTSLSIGLSGAKTKMLKNGGGAGSRRGIIAVGVPAKRGVSSVNHTQLAITGCRRRNPGNQKACAVRPTSASGTWHPPAHRALVSKLEIHRPRY
jgi:hypothetical protein